MIYLIELLVYGIEYWYISLPVLVIGMGVLVAVSPKKTDDES